MNTKVLYNRVRTSNHKNWSYTMDAHCRNRSEQKNRMEELDCMFRNKQYELERQLSSIELSNKQKTMERKMEMLKERQDDCKKRKMTQYKNSLEVPNSDISNTSKEESNNQNLALPGLRLSLSPRTHTSNSQSSDSGNGGPGLSSEPSQYNLRSHRGHEEGKRKRSTGQKDAPSPASSTESLPKLKRSKTDIPEYVPLYEPEAIGSVRRKTKFNGNASGNKFLDRALTDLEKLEHKHMKEYDDNIDKLKRLEEKTGLRLEMSPRIRREHWRPPPPTPETNAFPAFQAWNATKARLEQKQQILKEIRAELRREKRCVRQRTLELPDITTEQQKRELGHAKRTENRHVHFGDELPGVDDNSPFVTSQKSLLSKKNSTLGSGSRNNTPGTPNKKSVALPKINIGSIAGEMFNNAVENPFLSSADLDKAPMRDRTLLERDQDDAMYVWLGFENQEEFLQALRTRKKNKANKTSVAGGEAIEEEDELAFLDNLSEIGSSDDEGEHPEDWEDERFAVFKKSLIKKMEREKEKPSGKSDKDSNVINTVAKAQKDTEQNGAKEADDIASKKQRLRAAVKAVIAMKKFEKVKETSSCRKERKDAATNTK